MARGRKASIVQSKINMLLFGKHFTGKSTMASQSALLKRPDGKPFRVLYLDPESGSIDDYLSGLEAQGVNLDNIYIVYTQSIGEVREYIRRARDNEDFYEIDEDGIETSEIILDADNQPFRADMIVVDGASILNLTTKQGLVEFSKKRAKVKADKDGLIGDEKLVKVEGAGLELKDYQTVNFKGQDLVLELMASGKHFIVTARETDEKKTKVVKDTFGRDKDVQVPTGRKIPEGFKDMQHNVKIVARMFRDEETNEIKMFVEKDRTGVHGDCEMVSDPILLDWQAVIDKTANKKEFVIKNDLSKAVAIEQKLYEKELLGQTTPDEPQPDKTKAKENKTGKLIEEIIKCRKELPSLKKKEAKEKIVSQGLPIDIENITEEETLIKVLEIIKSV